MHLPAPQNQEALVSSGLVRRIIVAMDTHFSNAAVQHAGLLALWNVTEDPAVARTVLDAGPLSRVFQVGIARRVSCRVSLSGWLKWGLKFAVEVVPAVSVCGGDDRLHVW
jgi:hypothetical protein